MKFHVIGEPHTQTSRAYSNAAFTDKGRKFCDMMSSLGHEVILYASEDNDARVSELVTCITKDEQGELIGVYGPADVAKAQYRADAPYWVLFNGRAVEALRDRVREGDFICTMSGWEHQAVVAPFPQAFAVEHGIGYSGVRHDGFRVFESQAWMHAVYGQWYGSHALRGRFSDRVIPHFFDPADFTFSAEPGSYFLYLGRLNEDKGVRIASETAAAVGVPLVVAGYGPVVPDGVEYVGGVGPEERASLLAGARALFAPTLYLEPFGGVAVEAMMSGTPAITTNWGAFTETVEHGVTGYRCNTFQDFVDAALAVGDINRAKCHEHAMRYAMVNVCWEYQQFFDYISERG